MVNWLAIFEVLEDFAHNGLLLFELLHFQRLATTSGKLAKSLLGLLDEFDILDTQLIGDNLQITDGVDISLNVDNLGIVEASDNLEDGIDGANV